MKVRAITNGIWNASANLAGGIMGVVGSIIIVRSLDPQSYGEFSYYLWLAGVLTTLGTLALPNALTKIASEMRGQQARAEARSLATSVALGLTCLNLLLGGGLLVFALDRPVSQRTYLLIIAAVLAPTALAAVLRSALWGSERYRPVSVATTISSLLQLMIVAIAYLAGWGAPGFAAGILSAGVSQAVGLGLFVWREGRSAPLQVAIRLPKRDSVRRYLAFSAPATLVLFFEMIVWQRSAIFFLERFSTLEQTGYFNLGYSLYAIFLTLGVALVNGFYPAISRAFGAGEWELIRGRLQQGMLLAGLYAVPLTFGGWATLESIVSILYGPKMLPAVPVAQVLFAGMLPGVIAAMAGLAITAVGGIWLHVRFGILMSAISIALNLALVPQLGAFGGALATAGAQLLHTALLVVALHRLYGIALPWRALLGVVGVGALTTLLAPGLLRTYLHGVAGLVATVLLAGCLYVLVIWKRGHLRPLITAEVLK